MPCCRGKKPPPLPEPATVGVEAALLAYYERKVLPVESRHIYDQFHSPPLTEAELNAKPTVLLLGQYSVGKTTMIEYLLGCSYPDSSIGPEPTTDVFAHVLHGGDRTTINGPSLVADKRYPFQALSIFGDPFLLKLRGTMCPAKLLDCVTIIDTPGILSGDKQRVDRGYDFEAIVRFLSAKVDRIIMLFDATKLDISDEYKLVIKSLEGQEDKVKIVLNKADCVSPGELIQVRGALMWSLGKIMRCPEVPKVYIGSFWAQRNKSPQLEKAFEEDLNALIDDLQQLPHSVKARKINDVVKRAKAVRSHAIVMHELIRSTCCLRRRKKGAEISIKANNLSRVYSLVEKRYRLPVGDLPNKADFARSAKQSDPRKWRKTDKKLMADLHDFIANDVTKMLAAMPTKNQIKMAVITPLVKQINDAVVDESQRDKSGRPLKTQSKGSFVYVSAHDMDHLRSNRTVPDQVAATSPAPAAANLSPVSPIAATAQSPIQQSPIQQTPIQQTPADNNTYEPLCYTPSNHPNLV